MIHIITGVPGAGKTSNTLAEFLKAEKWKFIDGPGGAKYPRNRFVNDIPGFDHAAHGCEKIEGFADWAAVPDGSVVLLDECNQYFKSLDARKKDYPEFDNLETVRHRGIDLILIAQTASMLHPVIRGLCTEHVHYVRPHGLGYSIRYQFNGASDLSPSALSAAITERVKPDKTVFDQYRSTVANTQKTRVPLKYWLILLLPVVVLVASYMAYRQLNAMAAAPGEPAPVAATAPVGVPVGTQYASLTDSSQKNGDKAFTYTMADFEPRSYLDPSTAPIYDSLTQPTDFPRIAACHDSARLGCRCYTQQATPVTMDSSICHRMVREGWFDRWRSGRQMNALADSLQINQGQPALPAANPVSKPPQDLADPLQGVGYSEAPSYSTDLGKRTGFDQS